MSQEDLKETSNKYYRDNVIMTYPCYRQGLAIFGENPKKQLGESTNTIAPKMNQATVGMEAVQVFGNHKHTILLTKRGTLYFSGYMRSAKEVSTFEETDPGSDADQKIAFMDSGKTHYAFVNKKGEFYMGGYLREDHIQPYHSDFKPRKCEVSDAATKPKVKQVSCGAHLTGVICDDGQLYVTGNNFMKLCDLEQTSKFQKVQLPETHTPIKVHCNKVKNPPAILVEAENKETKKRCLFTMGESKQGLLGQGQGNRVSKKL